MLHCFSSGRELARRGVELGLYVSFSGILTFKNSDELRDIAAELPLDRLLVETDAPYLAPPPHRGRRNEPAYVAETAKVLAEVKGVSLEELAQRDHRQFLPPVHQGAARRAAHDAADASPSWAAARRGGVPRIGNDWGACDPAEPKNRRSRCALLIERFDDGERPTRVLVDTGPDMREQLLAADVDHLDGVLYTHAHADHMHGIDDLRAFWLNTSGWSTSMPMPRPRQRLVEAFAYCFRTPPGSSIRRSSRITDRGR